LLHLGSRAWLRVEVVLLLLVQLLVLVLQQQLLGR
jgi:hypothetical protein